MLGSNQPKIGYEPILFTKNLRVVAEDIGIEPNTRRYISLSRRTLSPSRFIFRSAHNRTRTYNLRRIRSALSPLSYMSGCGQGRTRTFNHSINSRGLYHWATSPNNLNVLPNYTKGGLEPPSPCRVVLPIKLLTDSNRHFSLVGADGIEPPSRCFTDTIRTLPIPPFLYTLQGSNLWPVVCKTTATTIWAKSACFSFS